MKPYAALLLAAVAGCNESVIPCAENTACDDSPDIRVLFRSDDTAYANLLRLSISSSAETRDYRRQDFAPLSANEFYLDHALAAEDLVGVTIHVVAGDTLGRATFAFQAAPYSSNIIHLFIRPPFHGVATCEQIAGSYPVAGGDTLTVTYHSSDRRNSSQDC